MDVEFDYVILDEAQAIKNAATAAAKAARLLRGKHRLALSGTPIENHLGELWSLFEFLNPGLLGTSKTFARYSSAAARREPQAMDDARSRGLRPFILRRTKAQVAPELPARTELTLRCELQGLQRELYDELRDYYRTALLGRIERDGLSDPRCTCSRRCCGCVRRHAIRRWSTTRAPTRRRPSSTRCCRSWREVRRGRAQGARLLAVHEPARAAARPPRRRRRSLRIPRRPDARSGDAGRAASRNRIRRAALFLISLKAGGLGLNLTAAEYVFLLDPWWNPAVEAQAIDRAHRIGQTRQVFAYRLIAARHGRGEDRRSAAVQARPRRCDPFRRRRHDSGPQGRRRRVAVVVIEARS